jgi:hypothetical protein
MSSQRLYSVIPTSPGGKAVRVQGRHPDEGSKDDAHREHEGPVGYIIKKRKKFHLPLSWRCGFYRKSMGLIISATSFSSPARSIEGALNKNAHQFRNYRFFQLLILTHTIHKKIRRLPSFRDKSP